MGRKRPEREWHRMVTVVDELGEENSAVGLRALSFGEHR
jgi:hypothetical protein